MCEIHFSSSDIEKVYSFYASDGEKISKPLKYPRLKEGAVPSQFPNCPAYLSKQTTNRIAPDTRKEEKEIIMLNKVLEQSIEHKKLYDNARRIKNLDDILNCINNFGFNQTWTMSNNEKQIVLFLLGFSPAPFIKYSVIINADLEVKVFMKNVELKILERFRFPKRISNFNDITDILHLVFELDLPVVNAQHNAIKIVDKIINFLDILLDGENFENSNVIKFIKEQLKLTTLHINRHRYSAETMIFSTLLNSISPSAYKFLRDSGYIILPHPRTNSTLCNSLSLCPGLEMQEDNFLNYIKLKFPYLKSPDLNIVLMLDEIHIKPYLDYKGGKLAGTAFDSKVLASSVHTFMISSLSSKFKDVVHLLPVHTINHEMLFKVIKKIILGLEEIGFKVICVVTDNNKINSRAMQSFVNPPKLSFVYPHPKDTTRPLFYLIDTVHLLKNIRNNWINQKNIGKCMYYPNFKSDDDDDDYEEEVEYDDNNNFKTASFNSLIKLHEIESTKNLKYGHNLSLKALFPSSFEKQSVPLALKIFNRSVAEGLKIFGSETKIEHSDDTAHYIKLICTWWDVVNVKWVYKGKRLNNIYQEPLTNSEGDERMKFLNSFLDWLESWKAMCCTTGMLTLETHSALALSTNCLIEITNYCINELEFKYILTGKLQTDPLEYRFGKYRQLAGGQYNVTLRQILEIEKKLRLRSSVKLMLPIKGEEIIINELPNINWDELKENKVENTLPEILVTKDDISAINDYLPVITYVAGYCIHVVMKKLRNCQYCKINYIIDNDKFTLPPNNNLIKGLDRGGLLYPKPIVVNAIIYNYLILNKIKSSYEKEFLNLKNQRKVLSQMTIDTLMKEDLWELPSCVNDHFSKNILHMIIWSSSNTLLNNYCKMIVDTNNINKKKEKVEKIVKKLKNRKLATLNK